MCRNKRLGMECLESRELLTVTPGLEIGAAGFTDGVENVHVSQGMDQENIDVLNNVTQGAIQGGAAAGKVQDFDASSVDALFADAGERDQDTFHEWLNESQTRRKDKSWGFCYDPINNCYFTFGNGGLESSTVGRLATLHPGGSR